MSSIPPIAWLEQGLTHTLEAEKSNNDQAMNEDKLFVLETYKPNIWRTRKIWHFLSVNKSTSKYK